MTKVKEVYKKRPALLYHCGRVIEEMPELMSGKMEKMKEMLEKANNPEMTEFYKHVFGKEKDDEDNLAYDAIFPSTILDISTDTLAPNSNINPGDNNEEKKQEWLQTLLMMDEPKRKKIEDILMEWKETSVQAMRIYQEITRKIWLEETELDPENPPEWAKEKLNAIDELNKQAHNLLTEASNLGLYYIDDLKKMNKPPCEDQSESEMKPQPDTNNGEGGAAQVCEKLAQLVEMEKDIRDRCQFSIEPKCQKADVFKMATLKRIDKETIETCMKDIQENNYMMPMSFYDFLNRIKPFSHEAARKRRQATTLGAEVTPEIESALDAYNRAALEGFKLSLEIMTTTRINASFYREMLESETGEPPAWFQKKLDAVETQMELINGYSTELNSFAEAKANMMGGAEKLSVCPNQAKKYSACGKVEMARREVKIAMKNESSFPAEFKDHEKILFAQLNATVSTLLFQCKANLVSGKTTMPEDFYKMIRELEIELAGNETRGMPFTNGGTFPRAFRGFSSNTAKHMVANDPIVRIVEADGKIKKLMAEVANMKTLNEADKKKLESELQTWKLATLAVFKMTLDFTHKFLVDKELYEKVNGGGPLADEVLDHYEVSNF